jgi:RimJ/RimL family protein N-acetyltransferase
VPATKEFSEQIFQEFTTEVTEYMTPTPCKDRAGVDANLELFASQREKGLELVFAILRKDTGEFLGCCGIHTNEHTQRTPSIGLWVKKSAHGHRYGREAMHALVTFAQEHFDVNGFTYEVDHRNVASVKIAQSLGGTVIAEKRVMSMSGKELEELVFAIPLQR